MLADSPLTPANGLTMDSDVSHTSGPLESVPEELDDGGLGYITNAPIIQQPSQARMSATELGIDSPPETPLQEKKVAPNVVAPAPAQPIFGRTPVFYPDPNAKKGPTAAEKGKAKADPGPRTRTSAVSEKENNNSKKAPPGKSGKISPANAGAPVPHKMAATVNSSKPVAKASLKPASTATSMATTSRASRTSSLKPPVPPIAGGGPRRVLINSAEAPAITKARK